MDPAEERRTPEKTKPVTNMELIKTPMEKPEENLYDSLVRSSPPKGLFLLGGNHGGEDEDAGICIDLFPGSESSGTPLES